MIWHLMRHEWFSANATCACRVVASYNYRKALQAAGVLEKKTMKGRGDGEADRLRYSDRLDQSKSVADLVKCLRRVAYEEPLKPCISCAGVTVTFMLKRARDAVEDFPGLCFPEPMSGLHGGVAQPGRRGDGLEPL